MKKKTDRKLLKTALAGGVLMLILLAIDLITKAWAESSWVSTNYLLGIVALRFTRNQGIAFGIYSDNPTVMVIITVLTGFMIVGIGVLFFTLFKKNTPAQISLAVIEAGAIGNLVDRLCMVDEFGQHYVRDFIDITPIHLGVCNIADFCIVLGAVVLVFIILFIGEHAVFPLKKEWREKAKREDEEKERKKAKKP
ncbi:MAG: signal peptidase II [Candidatus Gallimonas sp.]